MEGVTLDSDADVSLASLIRKIVKRGPRLSTPDEKKSSDLSLSSTESFHTYQRRPISTTMVENILKQNVVEPVHSPAKKKRSRGTPKKPSAVAQNDIFREGSSSDFTINMNFVRGIRQKIPIVVMKRLDEKSFGSLDNSNSRKMLLPIPTIDLPKTIVKQPPGFPNATFNVELISPRIKHSSTFAVNNDAADSPANRTKRFRANVSAIQRSQLNNSKNISGITFEAMSPLPESPGVSDAVKRAIRLSQSPLVSPRSEEDSMANDQGKGQATKRKRLTPKKSMVEHLQEQNSFFDEKSKKDKNELTPTTSSKLRPTRSLTPKPVKKTPMSNQDKKKSQERVKKTASKKSMVEHIQEQNSFLEEQSKKDKNELTPTTSSKLRPTRSFIPKPVKRKPKSTPDKEKSQEKVKKTTPKRSMVELLQEQNKFFGAHMETISSEQMNVGDLRSKSPLNTEQRTPVVRVFKLPNVSVREEILLTPAPSNRENMSPELGPTQTLTPKPLAPRSNSADSASPEPVLLSKEVTETFTPVRPQHRLLRTKPVTPLPSEKIPRTPLDSGLSNTSLKRDVSSNEKGVRKGQSPERAIISISHMNLEKYPIRSRIVSPVYEKPRTRVLSSKQQIKKGNNLSPGSPSPKQGLSFVRKPQIGTETFTTPVQTPLVGPRPGTPLLPEKTPSSSKVSTDVKKPRGRLRKGAHMVETPPQGKDTNHIFLTMEHKIEPPTLEAPQSRVLRPRPATPLLSAKTRLPKNPKRKSKKAVPHSGPSSKTNETTTNFSTMPQGKSPSKDNRSPGKSQQHSSLNDSGSPKGLPRRSPRVKTHSIVGSPNLKMKSSQMSEAKSPLKANESNLQSPKARPKETSSRSPSFANQSNRISPRKLVLNGYDDQASSHSFLSHSSANQTSRISPEKLGLNLCDGQSSSPSFHSPESVHSTAHKDDNGPAGQIENEDNSLNFQQIDPNIKIVDVRSILSSTDGAEELSLEPDSEGNGDDRPINDDDRPINDDDDDLQLSLETDSESNDEGSEKNQDIAQKSRELNQKGTEFNADKETQSRDDSVKNKSGPHSLEKNFNTVPAINSRAIMSGVNDIQEADAKINKDENDVTDSDDDDDLLTLTDSDDAASDEASDSEADEPVQWKKAERIKHTRYLEMVGNNLYKRRILKTKIPVDVSLLLSQATELFIRQAMSELENNAIEAGRDAITREDFVTMMKRQGVINESITLESVARKMPTEVRSLLIPCAKPKGYL